MTTNTDLIAIVSVAVAAIMFVIATIEAVRFWLKRRRERDVIKPHIAFRDLANPLESKRRRRSRHHRRQYLPEGVR